MPSNPKFQFSLRKLFIAISVGMVFVAMYRLIGVGGVPATLAVAGTLLCLWEWLARYGLTRSCTPRPLATLVVTTALMTHLALMLTFAPKAAEIAAGRFNDRYANPYNPSLPIDPDEGTTTWQLERIVVGAMMYGYPALCLLLLASAYLEGVWNLRGLTPTVVASVLILLPLCAGCWGILRYS